MFLFKKKSKPVEKRICDERLSHIAFIMDGNGRWAKRRGLPREYGHKKGAEVLRKIARYCGDINIKVVTVYAFSTENWKRPKHEVEAIMELLDEYLDFLFTTMEKDDVQVHFIGDNSPLTDALKEKIAKVESNSAHYHRILNVALNYGGRDELVHAFNSLASEGKKDITEEDIAQRLYTAHCGDPDLIVRTAGEQRLSNFLLWQAAYSEFYFTDTLWPDFSPEDVDRAVDEFYSRTRRYGGIK